MRLVPSLLLAAASAYACSVSATPYVIPFWGEAGAYNVPGLSPGGILFGELLLDTDTPPYAAGGLTADYIYPSTPYTGEMRMRSYRGFELNLNIFVVAVIPKDNGFPQDELWIQNFAGESPNDWHVVFSFVKTDGSWLDGDVSQPTDFSIDFDSAYLEAWFTDEYERVREFSMGVNIGLPPPNIVPMPAALPLLAGALGVLGCAARRREGSLVLASTRPSPMSVAGSCDAGLKHCTFPIGRQTRPSRPP